MNDIVWTGAEFDRLRAVEQATLDALTEPRAALEMAATRYAEAYEVHREAALALTEFLRHRRIDGGVPPVEVAHQAERVARDAHRPAVEIVR